MRRDSIAEEAVATISSPQLLPQEQAEQTEQAGHVLQLLSQLPENQQEVIRLKFQQGLSYKEISSVTGLTVTNVGFLIHTGIKRLRSWTREEACNS